MKKIIILPLLLLTFTLMAETITNVNIGTANAGNGDPLRTAMIKLNENDNFLQTQVDAKAGTNGPTLYSPVLIAATASSLSVTGSGPTILYGNATQTNALAVSATGVQVTNASGGVLLVDSAGNSYFSNKINNVTLTAPASGATVTIANGKTLTVSQDTTINRQSSTGLPVEFCVAMSDETTAIATGTAKCTMRAPYAFTVTAVRASVNTVSSSGLPTVNIKESGTTIFSTKLTIDASEFTSTTAATAAVISDSAIADDAELTFDIDVAGTGAKGLKVWVYGYR